MRTRTTSPASTRLAAIALLVAFLASACGSGVTTISQERATQPEPIVAPAAIPAPDPASAPPAPAAAESAPTEPAAGGHSFGTSIEDWTEDGGADSDVVQSDYARIEWRDLVPVGASGEELMARFEERLDAVEFGSDEAEALWEEIEAEYDPGAVNPDLDGQKIRLAGFVAPLTYEDDIITEFLLVPTFGACIHVPPPPPNQTIMVSVDKDRGLTVDDSWGAVWVEGTLVIDSAVTDLAEVSYRFTDAASGPYTDF